MTDAGYTSYQDPRLQPEEPCKHDICIHRHACLRQYERCRGEVRREDEPFALGCAECAEMEER